MPIFRPRTSRPRLSTSSELRTDFADSILDPDLLPSDIDELEESEVLPFIASFGPSFPFGPTDTSVLAPVTDLETEINQNIQSLLLTSPGECIGDPFFGVGVKEFIFASESDGSVKSILTDRIREQITKYYPAVRILNLEFFDEGEAKRIKLVVSLMGTTTSVTV